MKSEKILRGGSGGTYTDRTTCIIRQELKSRLECGSRGAAEKGGKVNYYISDLHWRVRNYEHI